MCKTYTSENHMTIRNLRLRQNVTWTFSRLKSSRRCLKSCLFALTSTLVLCMSRLLDKTREINLFQSIYFHSASSHEIKIVIKVYISLITSGEDHSLVYIIRFWIFLLRAQVSLTNVDKFWNINFIHCVVVSTIHPHAS